MNNWFQFKKFKIIQQQAAMKVGTDGVLLGAWAATGTAKSILDIGTGTGVIAIMLAQRSDALITGIEIEEKAAREAAENALNSPWSNRINIVHAALQDFEKQNEGSFDLIVSNPPFFTNSKKSKCDMMAIAKHNHLLPYTDLIGCASNLLNYQGRIALIIPVDSAAEIKRLAENKNLYLLRETEVRPNNNKKPHRYLLEFGKSKEKEIVKDVVLIHNDNGQDFTEQYKELTRSFYLYF